MQFSARTGSALESWTLTVGRQTSYGLIVDGRLVGAVGFMLDHRGGVELAYWVRPEARGRGVAVRMLRSVTESAHRDGGVARLWLEINPDNVASQQVARKAGYRLEERLAGHCRSWVTDELLDAARLDGCGFLRQYWHVALPAIRPGLAFLGIYTFIAAWNDYVWPLIVLVDPDRLTLQVALSQLNRSYGQDYSMIMAGALLAVVPLVVVFVLFARGFIADAVKGAIRG